MNNPERVKVENVLAKYSMVFHSHWCFCCRCHCHHRSRGENKNTCLKLCDENNNNLLSARKTCSSLHRLMVDTYYCTAMKSEQHVILVRGYYNGANRIHSRECIA